MGRSFAVVMGRKAKAHSTSPRLRLSTHDDCKASPHQLQSIRQYAFVTEAAFLVAAEQTRRANLLQVFAQTSHVGDEVTSLKPKKSQRFLTSSPTHTGLTPARKFPPMPRDARAGQPGCNSR